MILMYARIIVIALLNQWSVASLSTRVLPRANASCQQEPLNVNKSHNNRISVGLLTKF
jgi:hypothetical protein